MCSLLFSPVFILMTLLHVLVWTIDAVMRTLSDRPLPPLPSPSPSRLLRFLPLSSRLQLRDDAIDRPNNLHMENDGVVALHVHCHVNRRMKVCMFQNK